MVTVYRVENEKGDGPYAVNHSAAYENLTPSPEEDFEADELKDALKLGAKFGFRDSWDAKRWFGEKGLRQLKRAGFTVRATQASQVWISKSGRQVMFLPVVTENFKGMRMSNNNLGIVLRTPQMMLDKVKKDVHAGNCDWARFQLDQMKQRAQTDPGYAALIPAAEEAASTCRDMSLNGLGANERINETFENRSEKRFPMATVICEGGWKKCKEKLDAPTQASVPFGDKYLEHKSPTLVTKAIDGTTDITPQNMGVMANKCTRSGDKEKALRKAHVELVMLPSDVASTIGTEPGPHVRMCHKVNSDGALVPVKTPEETLKVAAEFRKCQQTSTAFKCARKKSQVMG